MCYRLSFCMVPARDGKPRRFLTDPNNIDNHSHTSIADANGFRDSQHDSLVQWEYRPIHPDMGCPISDPTPSDIYNPKARFKLLLDRYPHNYIPTRADWAAACVFGKRLVTRYRNHPDRYHPRIQEQPLCHSAGGWFRSCRSPLSSSLHGLNFLEETVYSDGSWHLYYRPYNFHIKSKRTRAAIEKILTEDFNCEVSTNSLGKYCYQASFYPSTYDKLCKNPERSFRKLLRLLGVKIPRNFDVGF